MRWFKFAVALLLFAALVGGAQLYLNDPVLVQYGGWQAQPPAAVVIALSVALLALLALAFKIAAFVLFLPANVAKWRRRKAEERKLESQLDVLRALVLEDERAALKVFARLADDDDEGAAICAVHAAKLSQNNPRKRDEFLRLAAAADASGENGAVVLLAKARLAYHQGQHTEALTLLSQAGKNAHPAMLRSLFAINKERQDANGALDALYRLRDAAPAPELDAKVQAVITRRLSEAKNVGDINNFWRESLRDGERKNTTLAADYARALHRLGDEKAAQEVLSKAVKAPDVKVDIFHAVAALGDTALCESAFAAGQKLADGEDGKPYLAAMAELAERLGYWGKARRYYQMANAAEPGKYTRAIAKLPAGDDSNTPAAGV